MNFEQTPEFSKELKKLSKKWASLPSDLLIAKKIISSFYVPQKEVDLEETRKLYFNGKRASIKKSINGREGIKMRLNCASLGSNQKLRIIFIAIKIKNTVLLVEIYSKSKKSREDEFRFKKYFE